MLKDKDRKIHRQLQMTLEPGPPMRNKDKCDAKHLCDDHYGALDFPIYFTDRTLDPTEEPQLGQLIHSGFRR